MYGVDVFIPIINPPETAILGVGRVADKLMMVEREVKVKPVMELSLSFDHRVVDGAPAALFLQKIKQLLENETGI
jgi:pyruvate dehydrogenase E2 component (dihydrolipoamide acetyltransferase)